ncbi:MAG TPA: efflux RND transporter periplasmic adaptor subunit [Candidatus Hydrogenedentes bacterium]|nr:efflux RND transporter periplasmic adaptor subunit [Candidatus Hydrogenedentota bacterium]HIJ74178.1 efflux RND transporter periplasmic adaptor subunit [Candidatus Hydrogenedentota bacterium]
MRKTFTLLVVGVILGVGTGVMLPTVFRRVAALPIFHRALAKNSADLPHDPPKTTRVKVQVLEPKTVRDSVVLTGSIEPWEDITVAAELPGRIEWQGVDEGDAVLAGQELVRIDMAAIQARLDQAKAQYKLSLQELERIQGLAKNGISSPQERDRARASHDVAQAELRTAEIQLAKSAVVAQIDGIVDRLFKEQGEYIDMGAPLLRLVQIDKIKVVVGIPERDVPWFSVGDAVNVAADAFPGQEFNGTIHRIATTADVVTRTFGAEIELENASGLLRPGMITRATLVRQEYPDSVLIPFFAVITREDAQRVFVEENGLARTRPVEVGVAQGGMVQIKEGLSPGDRLIVVGQRDLSDGEPVYVQEVVE